jgi:predicted RNase H-like HicB family nuclease
MYYPATLDPHPDGSGYYDVTFIDLPGCVSQGRDMEDALLMAQEALSLHISGMLADGDNLPAPSTLAQARAACVTRAREHGYELPAGTIYQYIVARPRVKEKKPVAVTISLRPAILEKVDAAAEEQGLTRSAFIVQATRHYIKTLQG